MAGILIERNRDQTMRTNLIGLSITFPERAASLSLRAVRSLGSKPSQISSIAGACPQHYFLLIIHLVFHLLLLYNGMVKISY